MNRVYILRNIETKMIKGVFDTVDKAFILQDKLGIMEYSVEPWGVQ